MQATDIPARFPIPFANGAGPSYIRSIPKDHVAASSSDAPASLNDGFPPETFTPVSSGGVPPSGADMNGILNQISAWSRWAAAGGPAFYDATFAGLISGYPKGATLNSQSDPLTLFVSTADNNTTDPDSLSAANWARFTASAGSGLAGSASAGHAPIGPLVITWRSIFVPARSTGAFTYGDGYTYSSFAHAWVEGDDGNGDRSISVLVGGTNTSTCTVRSNCDSGQSATLFSIGI